MAHAHCVIGELNNRRVLFFRSFARLSDTDSTGESTLNGSESTTRTMRYSEEMRVDKDQDRRRNGEESRVESALSGMVITKRR